MWKIYRFELRWRGVLLRAQILLLGGECGGNLLVGRGVQWTYPPHAGIKIGARVHFGAGTWIDVPDSGQLIIEDDVSFTRGVTLAALQYLRIGRATIVGEYSSLRDADHRIERDTFIKYQPMRSAAVTIGKDVWIGRGVAVLKGTHVGDGAVIGANAVVTKDVPAFTIAVGIPARVIGRRA
ncbi:MAG: hypothetical protein OHK0052_09560 [Anaerolineales bacterium]